MRAKVLRGLGLLIVAGLMVAAAGCGDDGATAERTPVGEEAYRFIAQLAANSALLTDDDFPGVWESSPADDEADTDDDEIPEGVSEECRDLFQRIDAYETGEGEALVRAVSDDFTAEDTNESVGVEVEVFRTLDQATAAEDLFDEAVTTCGDELDTWFVDSVNEDLAAEESDVRVSEFESLGLEERELGDWARDWRFRIVYEVPDGEVEANFTMTLVRAGRMGGTMSHFEFGETDRVLIETLREVFAERLAAGDATLPE